MTELHANGLLTRQRRLHFVGIGGAGMSGIAELCIKLGMRVSGCDLKPSAAVTRLASLGAEISQGHHPAHLKDEGGIDAVVISSAIKFSNPEVARARETSGFENFIADEITTASMPPASFKCAG